MQGIRMPVTFTARPDKVPGAAQALASTHADLVSGTPSSALSAYLPDKGWFGNNSVILGC